MQVDNDGRRVDYGVRTIQSIARAGKISVYPNPVTGNTIYIEMPGTNLKKTSVRLVDVLGRVIYDANNYPVQNRLQINLNKKPVAGVYLLQVDRNTPVKVIIR